MAKKPLPPVLELPVQWQNVVVDVESVAPLLQYQQNEAYDVANMTAVVCLQVPSTAEYRLLLSADVENGTSATVRIMSSDKEFETEEKFERIDKHDAKDYLPQLDKSGLVAADATEELKLDYIRKNFKQAVVSIPVGEQKLRIHASKKLVPVSGNPREYSLIQFAPLLGFTMAGGQTNLALTITFPPVFEGNNMVIDAAKVEPIPGQPTPSDAVTPFDGTIGAVRAFAWHWRTDPKITIGYRYQ